MNKRTILLLAVLALAFAQELSAQQPWSGVSPMRGSDAMQSDRPPQDIGYQGKAPGAQKTIRRTFAGQPPLIPHSVEGLEMTLEGHACLACHGPENRSAGAPRVPKSHFRDGQGSAELSMERHTCLNCHVVQANAKLPVANTFRGVAVPAASNR